MKFDPDVYYGCILQGDLTSALRYTQQFPAQHDLCQRYLDLFEHEQWITYDADPEVNSILTAYQQYARDVFYRCIDRNTAAEYLRVRLSALLNTTDACIPLCDLEQKYLPALFERHGLHFMGGQTSGYYGPYVWRTTETVSYEVALPDGVQTYQLRLLDGFLLRSWIDLLSFGAIGPGGWTDGDGIIHCVKSAWDFGSEHFRVSLLKHEAQHARDLAACPDLSPAELEYRAKLVELIYTQERNLLLTFAQEANDADPANGHAAAAARILAGFSAKLNTPCKTLPHLPIDQVQTIARALLDDSNRALHDGSNDLKPTTPCR